jgi:rhodanese-related sulfurtransferase
LAVFLLGFLCACAPKVSPDGASDAAAPPPYQNISAETAYQMMQETNGFVLLDVRTKEEFNEKHIAGAILVPVEEIVARAETELPDKNAVIFVYCRAGIRAAAASKTLADKGYTQVFNIGGIDGWRHETAAGSN